MKSYHTKKYPLMFTMQMNAEQRKALTRQAKKLKISAAEVIRKAIMGFETP